MTCWCIIALVKIGVFDSGMGGLKVLEAIRNEFPTYNYLYYGDTKNVPYGDKTEAEVRTLARDAITWLFEHDCAVVISACNSASGETLTALKEEFRISYPDRKVIGVIIPTVEAVIESGIKDVILIATTRTIESRKFEHEFEVRDAEVSVQGIPIPGLVELIEANEITKAVMTTLEKISDRRGEGLILGCTHYIHMKDQLRKIFPGLEIFSQDEIIPKRLTTYFKNNPEILNKLSQGGGVEYFFSGKSYI